MICAEFQKYTANVAKWSPSQQLTGQIRDEEMTSTQPRFLTTEITKTQKSFTFVKKTTTKKQLSTERLSTLELIYYVWKTTRGRCSSHS